MANPRQRRKMRSSSHKPVQHSRRAKKLLKKQPSIRGPKPLQDAWDARKTVRQNYEALGLVASLNPTLSGGVERPRARDSRASGSDEQDARTAPEAEAGASTSASARSLPKGHGRIVRDEDGNVVDIQLEEDEEESGADGRADGFIDPEHNEDGSEWIGMGSHGGARVSEGGNSGVVRELEQLAQNNGKVPRFSSTGESGVLRRLVGKHGEDVEAMRRDRKLNVEQHTAGELRRAIKKAGGFAALAEGVMG